MDARLVESLDRCMSEWMHEQTNKWTSEGNCVDKATEKLYKT